jgi:hypothetical protein
MTSFFNASQEDTVHHNFHSMKGLAWWSWLTESQAIVKDGLTLSGKLVGPPKQKF